MMDSSLALGRLELTPGSGAVGVSLSPRRLSGGHPGKETCGQRPPGPQGQAHLNGCVPLSHQVAGHKYGVDTVVFLRREAFRDAAYLTVPWRGLLGARW
ncbi:Inositol polyphosphate multikinase [Liparis tanakae]|uniref:Inositol polyphosphate multikinase n=1 Tax=Liparis tanakae TaxID=230148 RepID=A0A4Z2EN58_9TELE|nr:Inositol polyphosphate multikinase [Liparis tanakae]